MLSQIILRIQSTFEQALASGDLLFFPSIVNLVEDTGVQFELRLCPALQQKPQLQSSPLESTPARDPFAPPYTPNLLLGELEGEGVDYVVLLNKYSVIQRHFLLVTKEFQSQDSPLLPSELLQTYLILASARQVEENFFAFYNCGSLSGASQHHKHIQFIPVEQGNPPIEKLANSQNTEVAGKPFSLNGIPYAHYVVRLPSSLPFSPPEVISETLSQGYMQLLDLVIITMRQTSSQFGPPSYNVLITLDHIHFIPRSKETYTFSDGKGSISINSLGYAGMLLVKTAEEMEASRGEGLVNILRNLSLPGLVDGEID